jgi:beta-xylosidase
VPQYTNPVWNGYFADPFVLKSHGIYYAVGTGGGGNGGKQPDGRVFPLLRSTDLVHWEYRGGALTPLGTGAFDYWAPEIAEKEGRFYLYYSALEPGETHHRLRVAVADDPEGPYTDTGRLLLPEEPFSIDAHPFRDPADNRWYLFFARDYFDGRAGTGLAVAPLADDMLSLSGPVQTVLRASADWHIFERNRPLYDQVWEAWHTVEGAFVVPYAGCYYLLYSGGRWEGPDYGVGFAVADSVMGPYYEEPGLPGPTVLRGVEGKVLGPGHNSVVRGPDDQSLYVVYHAWDTERTARRMCIDPLVWTEKGPVCAGPTWTPQMIAEPIHSVTSSLQR